MMNGVQTGSIYHLYREMLAPYQKYFMTQSQQPRELSTPGGKPPLKWSGWKVYVKRISGRSVNGEQTSEA